MTRRALQRELRQMRKQALVLRAQHYRLALRRDFQALGKPLDVAARAGDVSGKWLSIASVVLSALPGRWGRLLSIGMLGWRLLNGALAPPDEEADASGTAPPPDAAAPPKAHVKRS